MNISFKLIFVESQILIEEFDRRLRLNAGGRLFLCKSGGNELSEPSGTITASEEQQTGE